MTNPIQPPPAGKPKSKLPMILLIIAAVLLLGFCCCGGSAFYFFVYSVKAVSSVSSTAIPHMIQERAAREGVHVDMTGSGVSLPDNFPNDVPRYPSTKITFAITPPGEPNSGSVAFQTQATKKQLVDFYKKELTAQGWKATTYQDTGDAAMMAYDKGNRHVVVSCAGDKDGTVNVIYSADKTSKSTEGDN